MDEIEFFNVPIPSSYWPKINEFKAKMSLLTESRVTTRQVIWMAVAKYIGAPYLYEDLVYRRRTLRQLKRDRARMLYNARRRKNNFPRESKVKKTKPSQEFRRISTPKPNALDALIDRAGKLAERYDKEAAEATKKQRRKLDTFSEDIER